MGGEQGLGMEALTAPSSAMQGKQVNTGSKNAIREKDLPETQSTDRATATAWMEGVPARGGKRRGEGVTGKSHEGLGAQGDPISSEGRSDLSGVAVGVLIWEAKRQDYEQHPPRHRHHGQGLQGLMKALVEQKRDISIAFIVWPAADEINGIGDTSKNLKTPLENNLGTLPHLCVQSLSGTAG